VDAGAALVDIEFMQFYPISVREEGVPTIFLYPDFPRLTTLINDKGENVLVKHLGEGAKYFAGLNNWDQLATVVRRRSSKAGECMSTSAKRNQRIGPPTH
jgi:succinate dehydrogenase / fumarate reductase, flavoprotein subunit